ncbi:NAD-dependent epimerase/dehydratase family protein [Cecembia calidifontis]|jgi:nucleoside-diphosphate-sugar epimerase|uniref:Nucleoside-diphosphate-sugar epimerase n=1 Tax=Cecembia calidifontis TaxID=1187080 RepID=A0A4Q7P6K7_9BACT|nr:NAD-dependent epimerase/dehydratase family protein [Cecembia calidifontis]RZS95120.1 nucleoside-diphosphate-sugar epimerase [Cecembia calidifontis]
MKILITGATGLFGSHLAKKFASLGEIYALARPTSDKRLLGKLSEKIHWIEGDLLDEISLEEALAGKDLVIHSAGMVSFRSEDKDLLMQINARGTQNLINGMLSSGVNNIIHISSVAALGRSPELNTIDETHKWSESDLNTPYAISKHHAELEVWRGVQEGLKAMVVYPSVLLGKISDQRSSTQIYNYVLEENSYFPKGTVNYIDVRDATEIVYQLYQKELWNEGFILNKEGISYQKFFEVMAQSFGKKVPSKEVKDWMLNFALIFTWLGKKLGLSKSPLNKQTAMLAQLEVVMDNSKVDSILKFKYTPLSETLNWAKSNEN